MTNVLERMKSIRANKDKAQAAKQAEYKRKWDSLYAEANAIYDQTAKFLRQFHKQTVDGYYFEVKKSHPYTLTKKPKDNGDGTVKALDLYVDGDLYAQFGVERSSYYCSCENACDHEVTYSHHSTVVVFRDDGPYQPYFGWNPNISGKDDEATFAEAMSDFIDSIKYYKKDKKRVKDD